MILILADVCIEDSNSSISANEFKQATAVMNPVAIAQFFESTYTGIFKCFLAVGSMEGGLLGLFQLTMRR